MSNSIASTAQLDASELMCPMPLLKTKVALRDLALGEVLHVIATDSGSWRDIPRFLQLSAHELLAATDVDGRYEFWIKKGA
ncbi:sulfurtransferase TusA family protein [Thalassolituus sp.]|uniref:sulfurtransferase TusA family protein n=1 Tax=Thalassolituus sp. TaxID=2030822 RepID=UPI002A80A3E4|nr:sulfurtransferase TusA family protein [Thalassolituus sp.]